MPVLANIWRSNVKRTFGVTPKAFTPKEFGQMKQLRNNLGELTSELIRWSISNWSVLCLDATASAGLPSTPNNPHIGFLLAHYANAVNLMYTEAKQKAVKSAADNQFITAIDKLIALQLGQSMTIAAIDDENLTTPEQQTVAAHSIGKEAPYRPTPEEIERDLAEMEIHI